MNDEQERIHESSLSPNSILNGFQSVCSIRASENKEIRCARMTRDGRYAFSISINDSVVIKWDVSKMEMSQRIQTRSIVSDIDITPDGTRLVVLGVGGIDRGDFSVWDIDSCELVVSRDRYGACGPIASDGLLALTGSTSGCIYASELFQSAGGDRLGKLGRFIISLKLSLDGAYVVSTESNSVINIWDISTFSLVHSLTGHYGNVVAVDMSHENCILVSASTDRTIGVWDFRTGSLCHILRKHTGPVSDVSIDKSGSFAVSASIDGTIRSWNVISGEPIGVFEAGSTAFTSCCIDENGTVCVVGDRFGYLRFLKLEGVCTCTSMKDADSDAKKITANGDHIHNIVEESPDLRGQNNVVRFPVKKMKPHALKRVIRLLDIKDGLIYIPRFFRQELLMRLQYEDDDFLKIYENIHLKFLEQYVEPLTTDDIERGHVGFLKMSNMLIDAGNIGNVAQMLGFDHPGEFEPILWLAWAIERVNDPVTCLYCVANFIAVPPYVEMPQRVEGAVRTLVAMSLSTLDRNLPAISIIEDFLSITLHSYRSDERMYETLANSPLGNLEIIPRTNMIKTLIVALGSIPTRGVDQADVVERTIKLLKY